tara:strand:+ start:686 stop:922 length:237 start_codon:yes stop_codon:yes gene_type:complete
MVVLNSMLLAERLQPIMFSDAKGASLLGITNTSKFLLKSVKQINISLQSIKHGHPPNRQSVDTHYDGLGDFSFVRVLD